LLVGIRVWLQVFSPLIESFFPYPKLFSDLTSEILNYSPVWQASGKYLSTPTVLHNDEIFMMSVIGLIMKRLFSCGYLNDIVQVTHQALMSTTCAGITYRARGETDLAGPK
jgi:hypothetical protein